MSKAFEGITVLDLGQVYQGPYCGLLMAYHGAKVIKIESLEGDVSRQRSANKNPHEFLMFNSNEMGLSLNLKSKEGKEIFLDLVRKADVIIENFTPGVMNRLGLGYERLKEVNPRIIYAPSTAYGLEGPYVGFPGMDLTVQAISGVMATTGFTDNPPLKAGPAVVDILGGTHLYGGIATALYQRERTGKGQMVEVSMHDAVYPSLASPLAAYYEGHEVPERTGNRHSGLRVTPYNTYETKDGYVAIICVSEKHWKNLLHAMEAEDLLEEPKYQNTRLRSENMEEVDQLISNWTRDKGKWEIVNKLRELHVPSAPVLSLDEVANDKHLISRGMIREINHPMAGETKVPGSPIKLSDSKIGEIRPSPSIGEHKVQVLKEMLNYDLDKIKEYEEKGII